jgi:hypothetical protein
MSLLIALVGFVAWTHFSSTGVVGSPLGGGFNSFIGTIGYTCDQIHSARVITAKCEVLALSDGCTGQERALFNMLRGGRMGLGIIMSPTLRLHKISSLTLEEGDKVVDYTAIFPPASFGYAAELYAKLTAVSFERLSVACVVMNAPLGMPISGPVMMISANFIGTFAASQTPLAPLLSEETKSKALFVLPKRTEPVKMNEQPDGRFADGNADMDVYNAMLAQVPTPTILVAVQCWSQFNAASPALAAKGTIVMVAFCTAGPQAADPDQETGFSHRGRGFLAQVIWMEMTEEEIPAITPFSEEMLAVLRKEDDANNVPRAVFPNNMRVETDVAQMYSPAVKMERLREVKRY